MALNFPNSPTLNQVYVDTISGFSYQWNGTVWISFGAASSNQIKILDDISGSFTGIAYTFALTSSSISILPPNKQSLIINLGGVIQDPSDDYSVSGSNIIFSTAPNNGVSFSGVSLGPAIPVSTILDGAVTMGSFTVAGILSTTNLYVAGVSTFSGIDLNGTVLNKSELKNYTETVYAQGNTGITTTLNLVNGNVFTATLTGNCTFTFTTGVTSGAASFTLILANDATAGRSITWPVSVKWPNNTIPVRTTTANATDIWSFFTPNNGTTWYGNVALYNFT